MANLSPECLDLSGLEGASLAVGGLYVLEGATLGGRTIARHLRQVLGDALGSATFLDFHGTQTSDVWKQFAAALNQLAAQGTLQPDVVIAGALKVFEQVHQCFGQAVPASLRHT